MHGVDRSTTKPNGRNVVVADIPRKTISDLTHSPDDVFELFDKYRALHISADSEAVHGGRDSETKKDFTWKDIQKLFLEVSAGDKASWCIETDGNTAKSVTTCTPSQTTSEEFLRPELVDDVSAYCSFLVQKDTVALENLLARLPIDTLNREWDHEPCVWIFFGRNRPSAKTTDPEDLQGRPEHTDSISHDGTWHFQLSGTKRWLLRPTPQLLAHFQEKLDSTSFKEWNTAFSKEENQDNVCHKSITVDCNEGDILVVNTRLWFHQTILPPQPQPSVSYARDFWAYKRRMEENDVEQKPGSKRPATGMTNVDGLYATNNIEEGTVVFREDDMPGCELHRSKDNYNCEVVELEEGIQAVVSTRNIAAGEFFCLVESDDEDDWDEEDMSDGEEEEG